MDKNAVIINQKIVIGISACCMGCPVRYNKKGWDMLEHLGRERNDFKWCPVCPESMAGLGVPREPIHTVGSNGAGVWTGEAYVKNRKGEIVTDMLKEGAKVCMDTLKRAGAIAYVYMEGSPSCGVYRTTLKKQKRGNPPGVFGSILLDNGFFLIPAADLQSPLKWWDWRRRLLAFTWLKGEEINNKDQLYSTWYRLKFLCQEIDNNWSRDMGKKLAKLETKDLEAFSSEFKKDVMDILRIPSTTAKIKNRLWKSYSHFRKTKGKTIPDINSPEFKRNVTTISKELLKLERTAVEDEILLGVSPVIYRDMRR